MNKHIYCIVRTYITEALFVKQKHGSKHTLPHVGTKLDMTQK